ncbi:hypothetical protein ACP4OV_014072 [Aristida adscensionis]
MEEAVDPLPAQTRDLVMPIVDQILTVARRGLRSEDPASIVFCDNNKSTIFRGDKKPSIRPSLGALAGLVRRLQEVSVTRRPNIPLYSFSISPYSLLPLV